MTVLESKGERDARGIDSFERAIVYSVLLLYKTVKDPNNPINFDNNPFFDSVSFNLPNTNTIEANLAAEVVLPIDRIEAVSLGGNYLESIGVYGTTDPNPLDIDCPASTPDFMAIVQEPPEVDTLERYLAWAVNTTKANLVNGNDTANNLSTVFFNDNPTFPRVRIQVKLPVNYRSYLRKNNLLCSLQPLLTSPVEPFPIPIEESEESSLMSNETLMNNNLLMGNASTSESTLMDNNTSMDNNTLMNNGA